MKGFHFNASVNESSQDRKMFQCWIDMVADDGAKKQLNFTITELELNKISTSILEIIFKTY